VIPSAKSVRSSRVSIILGVEAPPRRRRSPCGRAIQLIPRNPLPIMIAGTTPAGIERSTSLFVDDSADVLPVQGRGQVARDQAVDDLDLGREPGPPDQPRDDPVDREGRRVPRDQLLDPDPWSVAMKRPRPCALPWDRPKQTQTNRLPYRRT